MPKWLSGTVFEIDERSVDVRIFKVKVDQAEKLDFIPGQFVVMDLPVSEKRLGRWRSYSIANIPNEFNILEFCIVRIPNGGGTSYLFGDVKVGTTLRFKPPEGTFTILDHLDNPLILVCTGTGIAPFRSMVNYLTENKIDYNKIHLIYGTRYQNNLLYHEEFEELSRRDDRFIYDVALSRESFRGYQGYVHHFYLRQAKNILPNTRFYLCGWQNMIDEAVKNLVVTMKCSPNQIIYELYG